MIGPPRRAVVTDAQTFNVLAGIRALGRAGIPVTATADQLSSGGLWSRYVDRRSIVPSVLVDPGGFARAVAVRVAANEPAILYPGREESLDALLALRPELPPWLELPFPEGSDAMAARDKRRLPGLAEQVGLAAVPTLAAGTVASLRGERGLAPAMVKPARPDGRLGSAVPVRDDGALADLLARLPDDAEVLIQAMAEDPHPSVCLVLDRDGRVVARTQHLTQRTWPVAAGRTALAVSVDPDEALVERVADLLRQSGFWGLAEVQLMHTPRGWAPIDVNPRFYATMELAYASGVNLAAAWHAVASGAPVPEPGPYRAGVSFRWLEADLSAALRGSPGNLASRPQRPRVGPTWARDDAAGALATAWANVLLRVRGRVGRTAAPVMTPP